MKYLNWGKKKLGKNTVLLICSALPRYCFFLIKNNRHKTCNSGVHVKFILIDIKWKIEQAYYTVIHKTCFNQIFTHKISSSHTVQLIIVAIRMNQICIGSSIYHKTIFQLHYCIWLLKNLIIYFLILTLHWALCFNFMKLLFWFSLKTEPHPVHLMIYNEAA